MLFDVLLSEGAAPKTMSSLIQEDLHRLFNTRRGSLRHMPEYGLPDLQTIYQSFPRGKKDFVAMIQVMISRYEPRLYNVNVIERDSESRKCIINLIISATIQGQASAKFDSYFYSAGNVKVNV